MKKQMIESIGMIDMNDVDLRLVGQIEIFLSLDEIGYQVKKIVNECLEQYEKEYPGIDTEDDVYYDFHLIYTREVNEGDWQEYMIDVYIWQQSDKFMGKTTMYFEDIPLSLSEAEGNKVKQLIVDKVSKMLFGSVSNKIAVA